MLIHDKFNYEGDQTKTRRKFFLSNLQSLQSDSNTIYFQKQLFYTKLKNFFVYKKLEL